MTIFQKIVNIFAGLMVFLILVAGLLLYKATAVLNLRQSPQKSQYLVVLGGNPERAEYAAELYLQGYAPKILVSVPAVEPVQNDIRSLGLHLPTEQEVDVAILQKKGVPRADIQFFGQSAKSTFEEALTLFKMFDTTSDKLIIVSSPYHTRRVSLIYSRFFKADRFVVVGNIHESFPEKWWTDQDSAKNVILEFSKIAFFYAGGKFLSSPP